MDKVTRNYNRPSEVEILLKKNGTLPLLMRVYQVFGILGYNKLNRLSIYPHRGVPGTPHVLYPGVKGRVKILLEDFGFYVILLYHVFKGQLP